MEIYWKLAQLKVRNDVQSIADLKTELCILKVRLTPKQLAEMKTGDAITKVLDPNQYSRRVETYVDWFMAPPEADLSDVDDSTPFIKCRLLGSKCFVITSDRLVEGSFIITKRVDFEVNTATIHGLKSLGYTIAVSFKRTSTLYSDGNITLSIDEIRELNQTFLQIKGERKSALIAAASALGLDADAAAETVSYCTLCQRHAAERASPHEAKKRAPLEISSPKPAGGSSPAPKQEKKPPSVLELLGLHGLHDLDVETGSEDPVDIGDLSVHLGSDSLLESPSEKLGSSEASRTSSLLSNDSNSSNMPLQLEMTDSIVSASPLSPLAARDENDVDVKDLFDSFDTGLFKAVRKIQTIRQERDSVLLVVGIGGPAGSGKTSLAARLAKVVTGVAIIRVDDYIDPARVTAGESWQAAIPMDNPCCSCKLTRVRSRCRERGRVRSSGRRSVGQRHRATQNRAAGAAAQVQLSNTRPRYRPSFRPG